MVVNHDKLIYLITKATIHCSTCPLYKGGSFEEPCNCLNCTQKVLEWIQKYDDDVNIFEPFYNTPCEKVGERGVETPNCLGCEYCFHCPYN